MDECSINVSPKYPYTLKKILVNKLKFGAATIKLSIIDKKWRISALQAGYS